MNDSSKQIKEPLFRIIKRPELSLKKSILFYIFSIIAAIVAGGLFILIVGKNPVVFYSTVITGCFKTEISIKALIRIIIPLLITSLGLTLAFKMKFWNIGGEGQIIMGAIFATYFGLFHNDMPHWLLLITMFLAGAVGGGLWAMIPAFFKTKFGTNETLLTLMLNYVALYMIKLLAEGPWLDPEAKGFPKIAKLAENARLDKVFGIHIGWIIAIVFTIIIFIYIRYTKHGYEISVVGESQNTARYAGMNVTKIVIRTMFISGALCGIAGMLQATSEATSFTLSEGITGGVGFTAIIVAWLARLNPAGIFFVSAFLGILEKGCGVAESSLGLSSAVSDILQGIILFVIIGLDFFTRYKIAVREKQKSSIKEEETVK